MFLMNRKQRDIAKENQHLRRKLFICEYALRAIAGGYPGDAEQEYARLALEAMEYDDPPLREPSPTPTGAWNTGVLNHGLPSQPC